MGVIAKVLGSLFGGPKNIIRETVEVFRENADTAAERNVGLQHHALDAFTAEFQHQRRGAFDRFVDGLNRLPRPFLAFSTIGLFASAMINPIWFASRMEGIALVPEPLWWLMGAIVSFYFGARHQLKSHEFRASAADTMRLAKELQQRSEQARAETTETTKPPIPDEDEVDTSGNRALKEWVVWRNGN